MSAVNRFLFGPRAPQPATQKRLNNPKYSLPLPETRYALFRLSYPAGAEFDLWEPRKLLGTDVDSNEYGAPTWFENMTTDVERAAKFYAALFGWTAEPAGPDYQLLKHVSGPIAGVKHCTVEGPHPHWATYFAVKDAERITQGATKLGATVFAPVRSAKGIRVSGVFSPQGVPFYVM